MNKNKSFRAFCRALSLYDHFLLSCHVSPEADSIGSLLAMDSLLRRLGKKTTVICEDPFPQRLEACLSSKRWKMLNELQKPQSYFQALITTDCPTLERIGKVRDIITPDTVIFNIDHHISNQFFGHFNFVRPKASACGEVVFEIFKRMRMTIHKEEAKNLYIAIMTDTGSFKYSNTTVSCHRVAAELISLGIDVDKINDAFYSTYSLSRIHLYSRLLSRVKTTPSGKIAWVGMKRSDLSHSGATYEDAEGFIDFLKYLKEVKVAFFMSEMKPDRQVKVSFRAKGNYDVNKIATYFHGGGHLKASGCVLRGTLHQAEKAILNCLHQQFRLG
ncbi:MAG: bifunctional oligoribonuclease/PAP phosphatase NrnA [Candidatus Omnitrophica bacterium]|nr:bifunctional oligoribonuclease/PAP phosphatase NrnA [Candidatus Omnitrophota bacterium]MDD5671660.1 bifunctional oligoribonuclease/PAP phosphatase NrnA [Candidatus Omnitrophota bacterium]